LERQGVSYCFVDDGLPGRLDAWSVSRAALDAVVQRRPDVVHINGLMFPGMARAIRAGLPGSVVVLQDHSGHIPRLPWAFRGAQRRRWTAAFDEADAISFTARELAANWRRVGLPEEAPLIEIVEASTTLQPVPKAEARAQTGIQGAPVLLWVGRLNANKDPLTVLAALEPVFEAHRDARCWMIYTERTLEEAARETVRRSGALNGRVVLCGDVPHASMAAYYSAADIFVSGSHHEGSGYALIESLACGVVPVVTDIPAFRAIAGPCGRRWAPGDARACADALRAVVASNLPAGAEQARRHFVQRLSWDVLGRQTLQTYADLLRRRRPDAAP
jgi:glycosyltransferase involved in cell wall biosynthesis